MHKLPPPRFAFPPPVMVCRMFASLFSFLLSLCGHSRYALIQPKVFIIAMFASEANVWLNSPEFNVFEQSYAIPGLSPVYPRVYCTKIESVCLVTTGEGEINAASTISALVYSGSFNLTSTYFLIAGIAGISPKVATIGSVTLARYAVQVGLQYELDAREIPPGLPFGYFAQGTTGPGRPPARWVGTEVFELNDALRHAVYDYATTATLSDTPDAQAARALYSASSAFRKATAGPNIVLCDTATSDQYWSGNLLARAFENTTRVWTNGAGEYCTTQQEDNGTLNVLLRAAVAGIVDFSRIVVMRAGSDFDRPHPGQTGYDNLVGPTPGFAPALSNLYLAGVQIVRGILDEWETTFAAGLKPTNYIGDAFGTLNGSGQRDFGPSSAEMLHEEYTGTHGHS
ncbi:Purine nucleoside [Mycena kentingensis (nom. inval.)]|nr:Purine nucleoside [Mycena kentingensis (nom. inval.)]